MKNYILIVILLICCCCNPKNKVPTIEYQGEHFRLSRAFEDYDQYKEGTDNIDASEIDRIEKTILSVAISEKFETQQEFMLAALKIKFPGFGFGGLESPSNIHTATIEIPQKESERYITSFQKDGHWYVVDDFKGPTAYGGTSVQIENGKLIYKTYKGVEFRSKPLK